MDVRLLLQSVFLPNPSRGVITAAVNHCHKIAVAYLRVKRMAWKLDASHLGLSLDDIAYDAIAELFRRDALGRFILSRSFLSKSSELSMMSEAAAAGRLRATVMGAVNQQLFRFYGMADPSLARTLRNIKLALKEHPTAFRMRIKGENAICPRFAESIREQLPPIPPELMGPLLYDRIHGTTNLRDCLGALVEVLVAQTNYRRAYGLMDSALLIRSIQISLYEDEIQESPQEGLTEEEAGRLVDSVLKRLRKRPGEAYLRRGRLSEAELTSLLCTIREIILRKNGEAVAGSASYHLLMASYLPGLTQQRYNEYHRVILDYFLKLAKRALKEEVGKET